MTDTGRQAPVAGVDVAAIRARLQTVVDTSEPDCGMLACADCAWPRLSRQTIAVLDTLTRAQAEPGWWKTATPREIVAFQLYEDKLCMPFGDFQGAVEAVLGRGVWTHEFAAPQHLRAEFESGKMETLNPLETLARVAPGKAVVAVVVP